MNIFWFRRDLRLDDNKALFDALETSQQLLPIFIYDQNILKDLSRDDARVTFIYRSLEKINTHLNNHGKSLATFQGSPKAVWEYLLEKHSIQNVFINHDYEPYARERDKAIYELLKRKGISIKSYKDQVFFEKNEIVKEDNKPYVIYTPFSKQWKKTFYKSPLVHFKSEKLLHKLVSHSYPFLKLNDINFSHSSIKIPPFDISDHILKSYHEARDFPSLNQTSLLGPHLRFGTVSIRKIIAQIIHRENESFLNELIWREFFMQILWHFPYCATRSFKPAYEGIQWENDEIKFQKWCDGKTGYPLVDAGMRQLNTTGYMHNRVRMLTASFLCKHLLIDWRWGETYFANHLLDYEQASNVGNWQWAAGCGVDAAPYFRIFNPLIQAKKFDKDLRYIKQWIPELNSLDYPKPIVDHTEATKKCLKIYKAALTY